MIDRPGSTAAPPGRGGAGVGSFDPHVSRPPRVPLAWWPMMILSSIVALYALVYVVVGPPIYPPDFRDSFQARPWGIYTHAFFAMFALALGPFQFVRSIRAKRIGVHRITGRVYVVGAIVTGLSGIYMAIYSFGGAVTHIGFGLLGASLIATTTMAFVRIRAGDQAAHRRWMMRSFALLLAAVTLRIELPLLMFATAGEFEPAYRIVSWLCWVPNAVIVEWMVRRG